jgi:hypothetical protein
MNKLQVGSIISTRGKISKITEAFAHGGEQLFHAHYIDIKTGDPMECTDKRCHGEHTCPIHGANIRAHEAKVIPARELKTLREYGILVNQ